MKFSRLIFLAACVLPWLAGCVGTPLPEETAARDRAVQIGQLLPGSAQPPAPWPAAPTQADYLRFAVLRHPAVAAAYFDWRAAVEAITPARSLPDPKFTFEADIADTLMTFMPGIMFDLTTPAKRAALGRETAAGSEAAYHAYVATVLRVAAETRQAWIELTYLEAIRRLHLRAAHAAEDALDLAGAGYATGRTMGGLEKQLLLQNMAAEHHLHHHALADRLTGARARFKSALGLPPAALDPPWPDAALSATALPEPDELWARTLATNPELARMRAMVEMAVAGVLVAQKAATPDFSLGVMPDLDANPLMVRPTATVSLPIWRDKLAALVAAAEARRDAAVARVSAEQLSLAAELAQMLAMVRESDRMLAYFDTTALPNLDRIIASTEAAYPSGQADPGMIPETRLRATEVRLARLAALRDRELALTNLLLLAASVAPAGAPLPASALSPQP